MYIFGKHIKELREAKGISQREFAKMIGVDASNWNKIENGATRPNLPMIKRCLKELEVVDGGGEWYLLYKAAMVDFLPRELGDILRGWLEG